jgi:seryl-tRNA synthetase
MTHDLSTDFARLEDGRVLLGCVAAGLCRWFDVQFLGMAHDACATEYRFPSVLAHATLHRAGYFDAFPGAATALAAGAYWMPPAVCYHAYEMLAERRIESPLRLTAAQTCFRESDRSGGAAGRLWEFTMREVIFIGPAEWVAAERDVWTSRIAEFASRLHLTGSVVPATDAFFGPVGRGKQLLQQVKGLKQELRLDIGAETMAVASFNLHETFFGRRFGIALGDGTDAHSGCVAFGLERWVLALMQQRGPEAAAALSGIRHP